MQAVSSARMVKRTNQVSLCQKARAAGGCTITDTASGLHHNLRQTIVKPHGAWAGGVSRLEEQLPIRVLILCHRLQSWLRWVGG